MNIGKVIRFIEFPEVEGDRATPMEFPVKQPVQEPEKVEVETTVPEKKEASK